MRRLGGAGSSAADHHRAMENLRDGLLANHGVLVVKLDPTAIMPFLVSEGLLSLDEKQVLESTKATDGEKTDGLLTIIHRKGVADNSIYERFLKVLNDEYLSGGQHLHELVSKIYADSTSPAVLERYRVQPGQLDPNQKAAILSHEEAIVSSLNVDDVLADMVSLGVLSLDENEVFRYLHFIFLVILLLLYT